MVTKSLPDPLLILGIITSPIFVDPFLEERENKGLEEEEDEKVGEEEEEELRRWRRRR